MMTGNKLMGAVLQLAMQGKIVEQKPEEGTGEDLYQKIKFEKDRLVKRGVIKKSKKSDEISDDEKPFDIPESWKWVRVEDIAILNPKNDLDDDIDTSFIPMTLVDDAFSNHHTSERRKWGEIKKGFSHFAEGDIGVAKITPCFQNRKSVIFRDLINGYGAGTTELSIVRPFKNLCCPEYLLYIFKSELFINNGVKSFTGTAGQQRIHKDYLRRFVIPLPPQAEQKRIVVKIEELMPFVEQYAAASTKLNTLNASFPEMMKKSILQEAVQGKLVSQDPNDEPASVLLKKIAEEKKRLIKEGKIKKQKPLPEISEDEIPFDIPESWEWVRFENVIDMLSGFAFKSSDFVQDGEFRLLRGINLGVDEVRWDDTVYVNSVPDKLSIYQLKKGDVLLGLDRPWISNGIRVAIFDGLENTYLVQRVLRIREIGVLSREYVALILRSSLLSAVVQGQTTGISVPHISPKQVGSIAVPVPPVEEQKRIVEKVKLLCTEIDSLRQ